jgi:3-methyladenine DNA glycosylase AlkD
MGREAPVKAETIIDRLRSAGNPAAVAGMARYGINPAGTLGVSIPVLRVIAKESGRNHDLAETLWASGIHEARILAGFIDDPQAVTAEQMERWVADFDSWDVCDQVCSNLFDRTPFAGAKAIAWSCRPEEFVKRAGFVLMAALAVHDKRARDGDFRPFIERIEAEAGDGRNYVKKAVNWALRQIGKRNERLRRGCVAVAKRIERQGTPSARWISRDALSELTSAAVVTRLSRGR